jgi:NAD(P)-dependent dehydrogenase (short-subunit alcohol dehydrogenase family)
MKNELTILVTGASSGIGREVTISLAKEGHKVLAGIRSKADKINLEKISKNIIGVYLDVAFAESIEKAFLYVLKKTDKIDCIINNAGIAIAGPMEFMPIDMLKEQFDVNTFGPVAVTQKFLPLMNEGKIINISSMSACGIIPFIAPYAASKAAMDILFYSLSLEIDNPNIKIVSIKPGVIKTPIWNKSVKKALNLYKYLPQQALEKYKNEIELLKASAKTNDIKGIHPKQVSKLIIKIIRTKKPRPSYTVGLKAFLLMQFVKLPCSIVYFLVCFLLRRKKTNYCSR